ncbi:MAG: hypothetical protein IJG33_17925 [Selenomonadaceae bacterium]|nr:hypothetical protein [Selenomonadaceae bacterium]
MKPENSSLVMKLPKDRQAALQVNVGGKVELLNIKRIGYIIPDLLLFHGDTLAGDSCYCIQRK